MRHLNKKHHVKVFLLASFILLGLLLAACGGATAGTTTSGGNNAPAGQQPNSQATAASGSSQKSYGPQYLIKSSRISMNVKDTRKVAADIQAWILTTDPRSTSAGIDYEPVNDNAFNITMTLSVQATDYTQIRDYLRDYAPQHDGQLINYVETVQDVTNDFVDTQSRLKNLRAEQQRLLALMASSQSLSDTITIEQRLTDVEGQIEQTEAHLNTLNGQVTFYNITLTLQPILPAAPSSTDAPWSIGKAFQDAFSAAKTFGEGLVTLLVWLLMFSVYIVPVALVIWYIARRRRIQRIIPAPAPATTTTFPSQTNP